MGVKKWRQLYEINIINCIKYIKNNETIQINININININQIYTDFMRMKAYNLL